MKKKQLVEQIMSHIYSNLFWMWKTIYVGETCTMLTRRITLHRQKINTPQYRIFGVSRHIAECGRGDFSVTPFYDLLNANEEARKETEILYK